MKCRDCPAQEIRDHKFYCFVIKEDLVDIDSPGVCGFTNPGMVVQYLRKLENC